MTNPQIEDHRLLALWAADCAARVLTTFEAARMGDDRVRNAIAAARAWARGEIRCGAARSAALAAHAAARDAKRAGADERVIAAARAAGHAAATAHVAEHAKGAALYAVKAVGTRGAAERAWQLRKMPATQGVCVEILGWDEV